jgi:uncharacterized protein
VISDLILYPKRIQGASLPVEADIVPALLDLQSEGLVFVDQIFVRMRAQIVTKQILVQGRIDASIQGDCARCLSQVIQKLHFSELLFVYAYEGQDSIDLSPEIHDELLLGIPMRLLCKENCKGLCPHCKKNWNLGSCDCAQKKEEKNNPFEGLNF